MMTTTRSGLAAAAARMQLTEAPEGKSSLQIRLDEAERRAREAEVAAHEAQANLARTLLEAARVEAVVTARMQAEKEAEIEALRAELGAASRTASESRALVEALRAQNGAATGSTAAIPAPAAPPEPAPRPEAPQYRPIVLTEWDRPLRDDDAEDALPAAPPARWRQGGSLGLLSLLLPAIAAVFILFGYDVTAYLASGRASSLGGPPAASATTAEASGANWLLYMPVERAAVAQYLGGNGGPKRQLAETASPAHRQRN